MGGLSGMGLDLDILEDDELKKKLGLIPPQTASPWQPKTPAARMASELGAPPSAEIEPGPAAQRYQTALAQPEPQLHGLKRGLDIAGQLLAPGIEQAIPGTPGHYRAQLGRLGSLATAEEGQQTATLGRRDVASQMVQRQAAAEKGAANERDKEVHSYVGDDQRQHVVFQRPDGSTYEQVFGKTYEKPERPEPAVEDDRRYQDILQRRTLGHPPTAEEDAWAKAYESRKTLVPKETATQRAAALAQIREYPVINTETGALEYRSAQDINQANKTTPGRYAPAGEGTKAMSRQALIDDIRATANITEDAIRKLDRPFDASQRLKLALALTSANPGSSIDQFIKTVPRGMLTPAQQDYVIALGQLAENSMAMRQVLGAGQGAEDLRRAIVATIPGPGTPGGDYALKQLAAFKKTLDRLERGVPAVPLPAGGGLPAKTRTRGPQTKQPAAEKPMKITLPSGKVVTIE